MAGAGSGRTPCAACDEAPRERERRGDHALDAELLEQHERPADVDERVERAELVEVDVVGRHAVDPALDLGQSPERVERTRPRSLGELRSLDELADVPVVAVIVVVGSVDPEVERADPLPLDPLDVDLHPFDPERVRDGAQGLELRSGVDERSEQHVAREPGDTVEIGDAGHSRPRAMRAAIVPAPSPSSIPTTARPAAQEASIAFRAVVPPCADPYPTLVGTPMTGPACESAHEARERAVHPGDHDDAIRPLEIRQRRCEPVDAGDADVLVDDDGRPEELGTDPHLA